MLSPRGTGLAIRGNLVAVGLVPPGKHWTHHGWANTPTALVILHSRPIRPQSPASHMGNDAILSSITSTCRRHDLDSQRYLTQLLTNLPATPMSQLCQWLPDQWKLRNPA